MSIKSTIERAARRAREEVGEDAAFNYRDYRHNQFANAFGRQLQQENLQFEREKVVDDARNLKPDFVVPGQAVIEIKAKEKGFGSSDRAQMENYKEATGLPVFGVNFDESGEVKVVEK